MAKNRRRSGVTLIEVMIAAIILTVIFGVAMLLMIRSSETYQNQAMHLAMDDRGREVLKQISEDLRMTRTTMLTNGATGAVVSPSTTPIKDLAFRIPGDLRDLPSGTLYLQQFKSNPDGLFTRRVRYAWVPAIGETANDSIDNNKDGLVDEGMVEKTEETLTPAGVVTSSRKTRICMDVKKDGLSFLYLPTGLGQVEITLDLEKVDPKKPNIKHARTVTTTVEMRN